MVANSKKLGAIFSYNSAFLIYYFLIIGVETYIAIYCKNEIIGQHIIISIILEALSFRANWTSV